MNQIKRAVLLHVVATTLAIKSRGWYRDDEQLAKWCVIDWERRVMCPLMF